MNEIQIYRKQKSYQTSKSGRLVILFDIGFKSVVIIELIYLLILLSHQEPYQIIAGLLLIFTASLILIELNFIKRLKLIRETDSVIENLKNKLYYLKTTYKNFIFISALSSPLFVLSGFFLYYHFKYNEIRMGTPFRRSCNVSILDFSLCDFLFQPKNNI